MQVCFAAVLSYVRPRPDWKHPLSASKVIPQLRRNQSSDQSQLPIQNRRPSDGPKLKSHGAAPWRDQELSISRCAI